MGFWDGEHCEYCNGSLVEKEVVLHRKVKRKHIIIIEHVPAGVCKECGTRWLDETFIANGCLNCIRPPPFLPDSAN